jgi:hypothetical protein
MDHQRRLPVAGYEIVQADVRLDQPDALFAGLRGRIERRAQPFFRPDHPRLVHRTGEGLID